MTDTTPKPLSELTRSYHLTAAQCNARRELAPAQLVQQIIEVATEHADALGVGYSEMQRSESTWVLSRIAIEMKRYPRLFETYSLTTWIEGFNRHFSERNFEIKTAEGETIGYARTIWVAINTLTRRPADLSAIAHLAAAVAADRPCPIARQSKIRLVGPPQRVEDYTVRLCDIDLNRHVNSTRYVELILNRMTLEDFDKSFLARFEIEYKHEARFNDKVRISSSNVGDGEMISEISLEQTTVALARCTMKS